MASQPSSAAAKPQAESASGRNLPVDSILVLHHGRLFAAGVAAAASAAVTSTVTAPACQRPTQRPRRRSGCAEAGGRAQEMPSPRPGQVAARADAVYERWAKRMGIAIEAARLRCRCRRRARSAARSHGRRALVGGGRQRLRHRCHPAKTMCSGV